VLRKTLRKFQKTRLLQWKSCKNYTAREGRQTLEGMEKLIEQSFEYITDTKVGATTYKLSRKKKTWRPN
jgi:hypothetical protein